MSIPEKARLGVDLGGTKIEGVLLDSQGAIVRRERVPTPKDEYDGTLDAVVEVVRRLESGLPEPACVGIGHPGAISPATGRIKNANSVWLNGRALGQDLERRLGSRVRLANDANCFALSEAVDGAAADARVVFGVILGTGVGGGIIVDRRPWVGPNAIAGEWGHNPLPWPRDDERPGLECYCGKHGCIETFLSGPGLTRDHAAREGVALDAAAIAAAAHAGDRGARATLERHAERLARALAGVINVLDPAAIVLGGGLSSIASLYERVPSLWSRWVFSDRVTTPLLAPRHGPTSGARGAAWL